MRPQSSGRLPSAWRLPWMRQPALRPARRPAQRPARRRPARRPPARRLLHLQRAPSRHPGRFGRRSPRATTAKLSSTARGRASASWAPCTPASPTRCTKSCRSRRSRPPPPPASPRLRLERWARTLCEVRGGPCRWSSAWRAASAPSTRRAVATAATGASLLTWTPGRFQAQVRPEAPQSPPPRAEARRCTDLGETLTKLL